MLDFTSVHNIHERAVYDAVRQGVERYPGIGSHADLLADVACVALNRMTPRYIRHDVDLAFFLTTKEREDNERAINESVDYAFSFVQARHVLAARR
ncbi:MAG: late competence development ComFB family protein [Ideonella sp.]|nr:late competence development ComFB family protein [Ideonella sp.]